MSPADFEVARQRLIFASAALGGLLDLLNALEPGTRVDAGGVRALLEPAAAEVRDAELELRPVG